MRNAENDKPKRQARSWRRSERKDHNFAVVSIALMVIFLIVGLTMWVFNNSGTAVVNPAVSAKTGQ
jgi:hypothetical protein